VALTLTAVAIGLASASGIPGMVLPGRPRLGQLLSCATLCAGAALGMGAAVSALAGGAALTVHHAWPVPLGSLALRLDGLSAIFLLPILAVPALGSVYGLGYWPQPVLGGRAARLQLLYGLVTGSMALVTLADNALLFLFAWEVMAVCSFLLVLTEQEKPGVSRAAFTFLAATHVGTFALFALFSWAGNARQSFDFAQWQGLPAAGATGVACLALLLAGFGLKSGLAPLHFWLPGAHAAAPSHVSALMSGVLLKTGIYGLLRITGLFDAPPAGWGATVLVLGAVSAVLGVVLALAQHDLKRLLAYHSVENIGIIAMGVGLALLGRARAEPALVLLGFAGATLHVVNHSLFKSLLFLGAGSVQHATGTRDLEHLGGLGARMPSTSLLFLVGAAAISGLPPLNGFVSEWLVALGALRSLDRPRGDLVGFAVLAAPALGLVGGLAAACFVKVQGAVFLGSPRSAHAARAHESPPAMLLPMAVLALACAAIGLAPSLLLPPLARAAAAWAGLPPSALSGPAAEAGRSAALVSGVALALLAAVAALWLLRRRRLPGPWPKAETWGCGYAFPTARMQYTASSFAASLVRGFGWVVRPRARLSPPRGLFPSRASFATEIADPVLDGALLPAARAGERWLVRLRSAYPGRVQFHAVLILLTLVATLVWSLFR
jgi:formate hydrogenlyase subunit 3/multisubunit Na+/H+ antiporter MnhD subunit